MNVELVRVCPIYAPFLEFGGSVIADFEFDETLRRAGYPVRVLTCRTKQMVPPADHAPHLSYFKAFWRIQYGISVFLLLALAKDCLRRDSGVSRIYWFGGVWNLLSIIGPIICRLTNKKYMISPHGMLVPELIELKSARLKYLVVSLFIRRNIRAAYKVHCTVPNEVTDVENVVGSTFKALVYPLPVNLSAYLSLPNSPQSDAITVGFVGRVTRKKRVDVLVDTFQDLETHKEARLHIVGPDLENYWAEIEPINRVNPRYPITYFGPQFDEDLRWHYQECDIFVLNSLHENFAISVVEAASSGCALVLSRQVGVSHYFDESSAIIIDVENKDAFKKALEDLIDNDERRCDLARNAKNIAKKFDSNVFDAAGFVEMVGKEA